MNEQERAEEHLRTIRRLMERATIYRAISAPTALIGGLLSLAAAGIWLAVTSRDSRPPFNFIILWLLVFLLTAMTNAVFITVGARRRGDPVLSASMKAALAALAPPFLVATVVTGLALPAMDAPDNVATIAVSWAIFYGLGLLAMSHFAPRSLVILGWAFLVAGLGSFVAVAASAYFSKELYAGYPALFMAATFGLFHLIYAACAWPRKGREA